MSEQQEQEQSDKQKYEFRKVIEELKGYQAREPNSSLSTCPRTS